MHKPHLNSFVPGGDHAHLAAAFTKQFAFRSKLEVFAACLMGMAVLWWVIKTVYYAPKSVPPEFKRYQQEAYQRKLLAEVERQRGLRQRKGTSPSPPVLLLAGSRVPLRAQTKLLCAVCPAQPAPAMHR